MQQLLDLAKEYCQQRNLITDEYIKGMCGYTVLDEATIQTLIRYHKEWLR